MTGDKNLALYILIAVLGVIAALTIVIVNGRDVNVLVAALVAIIPLLTGIGVLVKQGEKTAPIPEEKLEGPGNGN